jgi:hypothetical protein
MGTRVALSAGLVVVVFAMAAPAIANPVKTTAVIDKITRTNLPGDASYSAKGHITATDDACLSKRVVHVIENLGPPYDDHSYMGYAETDSKGRWKTTWTVGPALEAAATGVHYIEVDKLKKGKRTCSFARSKQYVVPLP